MSTFPRIDSVPYVVIDTETTGLKWWSDKLFGISIALPEGPGYYWDVRTDPKVIDWLCSLCLLYTSPSPRDLSTSRMPSSA